MGQQNGQRNIPSLLEPRTIQMVDRYAIPSDSVTEGEVQGVDSLSSATRHYVQQHEKSDPVDLHNKKDLVQLDTSTNNDSSSNQLNVVPSSRQLPPALASCGGLHSFSEMAEYLPSICTQRTRRPPATLQPLGSFRGLTSAGSQLDREETSDFMNGLSPFLRNVVPEAYLSAKEKLMNSSLAKSINNPGECYQKHQFEMNSASGIQSAGSTKPEKQPSRLTHKSEPNFQRTKLPPISCMRCTVHSTACTCVHKKSPREPVKEKENAANADSSCSKAAQKKIFRTDLKESNSKKRAGKRDVHKSKQKAKHKTQAKEKTSDSSPEQKNVSPVYRKARNISPVYQKARNKTFELGKEDESFSSEVKGKRPRFSFAPEPSNSCTEEKQDQSSSRLEYDEDDEQFYFHRLTSILHPSPKVLPPITAESTTNQPHQGGSCIVDQLMERADENEHVGWARDGFLDDSTLQRAIALRCRALHRSNNFSMNNTPSRSEAEDGDTACEMQDGAENTEENLKKRLQKVEDIKEIPKVVEPDERTLETKLAKVEEIPEPVAKPQYIKSVTWQEVSSHLGPKKEKEQKKRMGRAGNRSSTTSKGTPGLAAEFLRHLQQNEAKPRNNPYLNAELRNLPPLRFFDPQDLSINCLLEHSKSAGSLSGNHAKDTSFEPLFLSSYQRFIKMFSVPKYKTQLPPTDHSGKEESFGGTIAGIKVKQRDYRKSNCSGSAKVPLAKGQPKKH